MRLLRTDAGPHEVVTNLTTIGTGTIHTSLAGDRLTTIPMSMEARRHSPTLSCMSNRLMWTRLRPYSDVNAANDAYGAQSGRPAAKTTSKGTTTVIAARLPTPAASPTTPRRYRANRPPWRFTVGGLGARARSSWVLRWGWSPAAGGPYGACFTMTAVRNGSVAPACPVRLGQSDTNSSVQPDLDGRTSDARAGRIGSRCLPPGRYRRSEWGVSPLQADAPSCSDR